MKGASLLLSGRCSRKSWWTWVAVLLLIAGVCAQLTDLPSSRAIRGLANILGVAILLAFIPITIRRLHDRGWSGWLTVVFLLPLVLGEAVMRYSERRSMAALYAILALTAVLFFWYVIEMGFLRGTVGPNRFGPDPVGSPEERYAALMARRHSGVSGRALIAALAHDPELIGVHKLKTGEDLSRSVAARGPPFRLDAVSLLVRPLLVAGVINAAMRAASSPYAIPNSVSFWGIWVILVPAWIFFENIFATAGWEEHVKLATSSDTASKRPET